MERQRFFAANTRTHHRAVRLVGLYGATTVVVTAVLLAWRGSSSVEVTVAVFLTVAALSGLATMSIATLRPGLILPSAHVTTRFRDEHVPWLGVALISHTSGGRVSVKTTADAVAGPRFVTVSREVSGVRMVTGSGVSLFVNDKSA